MSTKINRVLAWATVAFSSVAFVTSCVGIIRIMASPSVDFERELHDFGSIPANCTTTFTFSARNAGIRPWRISRLLPSCGCVRAATEPESCPPGSVASINVTLSTTGMVAPAYVQQQIGVFIRGRVSPVQLTVIARVEPQVEIRPVAVRFVDHEDVVVTVERKQMSAGCFAGSQLTSPAPYYEIVHEFASTDLSVYRVKLRYNPGSTVLCPFVVDSADQEFSVPVTREGVTCTPSSYLACLPRRSSTAAGGVDHSEQFRISGSENTRIQSVTFSPIHLEHYLKCTINSTMDVFGIQLVELPQDSLCGIVAVRVVGPMGEEDIFVPATLIMTNTRDSF